MCTRHQRLHTMWIAGWAAAALMIAMSAGSAKAQDSRKSSITAQVLDEQGAAIVGAQATLTDATGRQTSVISNPEGKVVFSDLPVGNYTIRINAENFKSYEDQHVQLAFGRDTVLNVTLRVAGRQETIEVVSDNPVSKDAEYLGGTLILRGDALMAMDDAAGLEGLLRALAIRTSGPFGPVALVNGFENNDIPPVYAIREIRINNNPF